MRYFFRKQLFLFLFFSSFFHSCLLSAQTPPLTELEQQAIVGRDLGFHRKYDEALAHFKKLGERKEYAMLASFAQMSLWQARMLENYDFRFEKDYLEVSDENLKLVQAILADENSSEWDLFLAGASSGLRAFYYIRKDKLFKALKEANTANKAFERVQAKAPWFVDVNLGLGMHEYWRSVFTSRFRFLPFFKDRRAEGIAKIEKAAREGRVVGPLAQVVLALCLTHERKFDRTELILQEILKKYPENLIAQVFLGGVYIEKGKFGQAHALFDQIQKADPSVTVARFFRAKATWREGKLIEARKLYEEYLATDPAPSWRSYALTDLGFIDLQENKQKEAFNHFKQAYQADSNNPIPLKEFNKLREKRW